MEVIIGIPARRTLFHYGLELEGLHYNSHQLQEIRRRAGENIVLDLKFYEDTVGNLPEKQVLNHDQWILIGDRHCLPLNSDGTPPGR